MFYAVKKGHSPGIYESWDGPNGAKVQVEGFKGAVHQKFNSRELAEAYLNGDKITLPPGAVIFTDGSFNKETRMYGGAYVVFNNGAQIMQGTTKGSDPSVAGEQNSVGELMAVMAAVKWAASQGHKTLLICYDYNGVEFFATGVWKAHALGSIRYAEWIKQAMSMGVKLTFKHVKGHSGNPYNDMVDNLAKKAVGLE